MAPEFAEKLKVTTVLVNGNNITHLQWKNTRLQDGGMWSLSFRPLAEDKRYQIKVK